MNYRDTMEHDGHHYLIGADGSLTETTAHNRDTYRILMEDDAEVAPIAPKGSWRATPVRPDAGQGA